MAKINTLQSREILDSRGEPTIEVELGLGGVVATASVPSGASTGIHEALELRDNDMRRYRGRGVHQAMERVDGEIRQGLMGKEYTQEQLDQFLIDLDGTENKSRLGANAILGVSLAFARAQALEQGREVYEYLGGLVGQSDYAIPQPLFNIINGGKHADSGLDIQEYMLAPIAFESIHEKIRVGSEIIHTLRDILKDKGYASSVGDEGGFAPKLSSNEEACDLMVQAIQRAGYTTEQVHIGIDAAASSFFSDGNYHLKIQGKKEDIQHDELIKWYQELSARYPLMLIEDGCAQDDWEGFTALTQKMGTETIIVGDDLLVTNVQRIAMAIEAQAVNAVLIKPNQIGTVTETIQAIMLTKKQGWKPFISHRSGETTDTFIADLA
ncbi:MAG TPA: phosphopyruvate hydratase, partial [Candidatus Paceibacterota bacterium]|nr:phosphopyruvate hydratase [Candidatus Paceibacterota bacterium]